MCPHCTTQNTSLSISFPEIAKELNSTMSPSVISFKSKKIVEWKCSHNHKWEDRVVNRCLYHHSCPICKCNEIVSLARRCPSIISYWDYQKNGFKAVSPDSVSIGSRKRVFWRCSACQGSFSGVVSQVVTDFFACTSIWIY